MKKFQFLLLDAGPIIRLFELKIWDKFIERCDIAITRIVEKEVQFARKDRQKEYINLKSYEGKGLNIKEVEPKIVADFFRRFDLGYQPIIDDGEKETLAYLESSTEKWIVCSSDAIVYKILANLNKSEQGISLEELLQQIGLVSGVDWKKVTSKDADNWKHSKAFREKNTRQGRIDSIQNRGLK